MEEYPPTVNNESTNPKPNRLTALAFLEVGLFEFFFVAVVLFLLFGILNYFNILPVSDAFPKYLSWLPRKEVPSGTSQTKTVPQGVALQTQKDVPNGTSLPTPTPPVTAMFVNNILKPYIASVFNSRVNYSISNISEYSDKNNSTKSGIILNLNTSVGTMAGILKLSKDNSILSINLSLTEITPFPNGSSFDLIQKETSRFFSVEPKGKWGCKPLDNPYVEVQFCENFWQEQDGTRRGIYYQNPTTVDTRSKETKGTFAFCEFRLGSISYDWKSCISAFSKTGI